MWYPIRLSECQFIGLYGRLSYHILWFYSFKYTRYCVVEESDQQCQKVTDVDRDDIQQNNPQIFSYQVPDLFQCSPLPCSYIYCLATNTFMNPRGQIILSFILNVFETIQSVHDPEIESSFSKFVNHKNPRLLLSFTPNGIASPFHALLRLDQSRAMTHDSISLPIRSVLCPS